MEAILMRHLISTSPAELLIASIWQGLMLTALAWMALRLAPGLRASTRFTLWFIVFLLVALLPCFALGHALSGVYPSPSFAGPAAGFSLHLNILWAFALEAVWLFASLLSFGRLWASGRQMRSVLRGSTPAPEMDPEIRSLLARRDKRSVEVRLSDAVDAPSVIGFFRPAIVIPRSLWSELETAELKQIIQHEVAHLDRGDDWTNLLQKLLRAVCPLNPALFWAERHLCREREQACDDAVLDAHVNARAYATCLTKLAESRLVRQMTSLAPGLLQRRSELAGRVENILHRRRRLGPLFSSALVAAGMVFSLTGAVMLQRCPGLITFASTEAAAAVAPGQAAAPNQARYQEAVFHPTMSPAGEHASALPRARSTRPVRNTRRLQFVQWTENPDGGGITLVVFTVEVPQDSGAHGVSRSSLPTHRWIAFQI